MSQHQPQPRIEPQGQEEKDTITFAPWLDIPPSSAVRLVTVEHPCIITASSQDDNKWLSTLGGEDVLSRFFTAEIKEKKTLGLYLNPDDGFRKAVPCWNGKTSDVLVKVTLPKRTGRKRRKGEVEWKDEHFGPGELAKTQAQRALRGMRDNVGKCSVVPIGFVEETVRFRALPDFQWSMEGSEIGRSIRESILPGEYEKLKDFTMDLETSGNQPSMDMIPPPTFSQSSIPFNYAYHQNPHVKLTLSPTTSAPTLSNIYLAPTAPRAAIPSTHPTIPTSPPPSLPPVPPHLHPLIATVTSHLHSRPIWTRRALLNTLPPDVEYDLKLASPHLGYAFSTGPWRDALVRFGYDPRADPDAWRWQTMVFKLSIPTTPARTAAGGRAAGAAKGAGKKAVPPAAQLRESWTDQKTRYSRQAAARASATTSGDRTTHIFDGTRVVGDGKVWQVCDIRDPHVLRILGQADAQREVCDVGGDGWLTNGALAKVKVVLRDKIGLLGRGIEVVPGDYERLVGWPNRLTEGNVGVTVGVVGRGPRGAVEGGSVGRGSGGTGWTQKEVSLATQVRALAGRLGAATNRAKRERGLPSVDPDLVEGVVEEDVEGDDGGEDGEEEGEGEDDDEADDEEDENDVLKTEPGDDEDGQGDDDDDDDNENENEEHDA